MVNRESRMDAVHARPRAPRLHSRFTIRYSRLAGRRHRPPSRGAGERHLLDGLEVDDRALEVEDGLQLVIPRLRQVPLGLEDEEVRGRAGGELALLRVQPALSELARGAGRIDALL